MIEEKKAAPELDLPGSDGQRHRLSDHRGKPVVVYFYPKDATPGCTTEACDFRDNMARLTAAGAVVYGVSKDSLASHDRFIAKHGLNFVLLSDEDLAVHKLYGAFGTKKMYGKTVEGVIRTTVLVGADGAVARIWSPVRVDGHVDKVLAALSEGG